MIKKFDFIDDLLISYNELFVTLSESQGDMSPQIFNNIIDSAFDFMKLDIKLFKKQNNYRQAIKEAKLNCSLFTRNWKNRFKENFYVNNPALRPPEKISFLKRCKLKRLAKKRKKS